jgi:quercetin dioxygenase-like cupin family protein
MPFSTRTTAEGVFAGPEEGLERLLVQIQPVAPDEVVFLHRHDGEQILMVVEGEVLIEVDGHARVCRAGDVAVAPTGAAHGFCGLGAPALLEVVGEQRCGTEFLLRGGMAVEVHRPGVPWDRPGPVSELDEISALLLAPSAG